MKYKIPFIKPHFPKGEDIAKDFDEIVKSNWYTNFGAYEKKFRKGISDFIEKDDIEVCTVSNGTLALDIAILALLKKENPNKNKVITQSFTFAAASERLIANGYTPVLIDINDDLQPDIEQAKKYLESNHAFVAGILICNTFGVGNKDIVSWEKLAKKYELPLIIDSAAGLGSEYKKGEKIGGRGDCEIFSFHATKPFCIGEGGAITSSSVELISEMRSLSNFGFGENRDIQRIGTNAKLPELSCAIGVRQLKDFSKRIDSRRLVLKEYKKYFKKYDFIFQINDSNSSVPFATMLAKDKKTADKTLKNMIENGIEARKYYHPLHLQPVISKLCDKAGDLSVTEDVWSKVISVPVHDNMSEEDISVVVSIEKVLTARKK